MKTNTKRRPLNFDSADEYLSYKRRLLEEKDKEKQKTNPTFNIYSFYFTYMGDNNHRKTAKPVNIAAETQYEAEQIFGVWAEFHSIRNVVFKNIVEVFWVVRTTDTAKQNLNFAYDYKKKEITEVYQDDYLEWYWNHVDTWDMESEG